MFSTNGLRGYIELDLEVHPPPPHQHLSHIYASRSTRSMESNALLKGYVCMSRELLYESRCPLFTDAYEERRYMLRMHFLLSDWHRAQ